MPASVRRSITVEGVERVKAALRARAVKAAGRPRVIVGYETPYCVYVHEDLTKYHPHGQAKFLEQPAREYGKEMGALVRNSMRNGQSVLNAELVAARFLLAKSLHLVPVDTGALKASGFVRVDQDA